MTALANQIWRLDNLGQWVSPGRVSAVPPPLPGASLRVARVAVSTVAPATATYIRPSGAGFYRYEDLGVANLQAGIDKVATYSAGANGQKTLTLPNGVFEANSYPQPSDLNPAYLGFLVPSGVSIVGSGPGTVLQVKPNTVTAAQASKWASPSTPSGSNYALATILFNGGSPQLGQFTLRGTSQKIDGTGNQVYYNGMNVRSAVNAVLTDIWVDSVPGHLNSPPGETFGLNIFKCSGTQLTRVEVDGTDKSGTRGIPATQKISAAGIGINNSTNTTADDCYVHDTGFSHGIAIYQSNTVITNQFKAINCGTGSASGGGGGTSGDGINVEQSTDTHHHYPTLGGNSLSAVRLYGQINSTQYSGDTGTHYFDHVTIFKGPFLDGRVDSGPFVIRIDNAQTTYPQVTSSPTPTYDRRP